MQAGGFAYNLQGSVPGAGLAWNLVLWRQTLSNVGGWSVLVWQGPWDNVVSGNYRWETPRFRFQIGVTVFLPSPSRRPLLVFAGSRCSPYWFCMGESLGFFGPNAPKTVVSDQLILNPQGCDVVREPEARNPDKIKAMEKWFKSDFSYRCDTRVCLLSSARTSELKCYGECSWAGKSKSCRPA